MNRFIVRLLIVTVLANNMAWAMDECFSLYGSNEPALTQSGDLYGDSLSEGVCDEFCAGWLHLVGITPGTKLDCPLFTREDVVWTNISYHSLDQTPPFRPPQI